MKQLRVIFTIFFLMPLFVFMSNSFAQINWIKHGSPVLLAGSAGEWDDEGVFIPYVIYDGNTYKMWYSGRDGSHFRIGYATSPDGINWTKYNDPSTVNPPYAESDPVLNPGPGNWENDNVYAQTVYFDGANYQMWYIGNEGTTDHVGYASSPDGIAWTKNGNPVLNPGSSGSWDDAGIGTGPIFFNGSTFELIYNGYDGLHFQGGYATSPDGISWTKSVDPKLLYGQPESWDNPRAQPGSVVFNSNTSKYYLFYSGGAVYNWRIGYATSSSFGGPWTKDTSILLDVTSGSWETNFIAFPSVVEDLGSSLYKMWYSSQTTSGPYGIGYATADMETIDTIYIPTDYSTIQEGIDVAETGNIILVDEGTYYENINFRGKAITVASRFLIDDDTLHISKTIIDGSNFSFADSASLVYFVNGEDSTSILSGFTLQNGHGTFAESTYSWRVGGAILMQSSGGTIQNNIIKNNTITSDADYVEGGGIDCFMLPEDKNLIIIENTFTHNLVQGAFAEGGAINCGMAEGSILISRNRVLENNVKGNSIGNGGGISLAGASNENVRITNNFISKNTVTGGGDDGGGIFVHNLKVDILNNIITENSCYGTLKGSGGGISAWYESIGMTVPVRKVNIVNNTIVKNYAQHKGSGIYVYSMDADIINNIIRENNDPTLTQLKFDGASYTHLVAYSNIDGGYEGEGNIDVNPLFCNPIYYLLTENVSECIDAGNPDVKYNDLLDGANALYPAMGSSRNDMGAFGGPYSRWSEVDSIISITNIEDEYMVFPQQYKLSQNYPNPFNPTTKIKYTIPKHSKVVLKIYDVLGKEVETLVNEEKTTGIYEVKFNAKNLTSGVYFYKLKATPIGGQAGEFIQTKKMLLLK